MEGKSSEELKKTVVEWSGYGNVTCPHCGVRKMQSGGDGYRICDSYDCPGYILKERVQEFVYIKKGY